MSLLNTLIEVAGSLGGFLFATACIPMAVKTIRAGRDIGNPISTIWTFVGATLLFSIYLIAKTGIDNAPSIFLVTEFVCWSIAAWYHYFPRFDWDHIVPKHTHIGFCTRDDGHEGPCNGWARHTCPGYANMIGPVNHE